MAPTARPAPTSPVIVALLRPVPTWPQHWPNPTKCPECRCVLVRDARLSLGLLDLPMSELIGVSQLDQNLDEQSVCALRGASCFNPWFSNPLP